MNDMMVHDHANQIHQLLEPHWMKRVDGSRFVVKSTRKKKNDEKRSKKDPSDRHLHSDNTFFGFLRAVVGKSDKGKTRGSGLGCHGP